MGVTLPARRAAAPLSVSSLAFPESARGTQRLRRRWEAPLFLRGFETLRDEIVRDHAGLSRVQRAQPLLSGPATEVVP